VIVSAGSPAAERAWLISASTCAAAVLPWVAGGLAGAAADFEGRVPAVPVAGADRRGDGGREDADGTLAIAGGAATARPAGSSAHRPAASAPHPAAVVRGLTVARLDAGAGENSLRAR